MHRFICANKNK